MTQDHDLLISLNTKIDSLGEKWDEVARNGFPRCSAHTQALEDLWKRVDRVQATAEGRKPEPPTSDGSNGKWAFQFGKFKAVGTPAIIIAVLIGVAAINYVQTRAARNETLTTAATMAEQTRAEVLSLLRTIKHESHDDKTAKVGQP